MTYDLSKLEPFKCACCYKMMHREIDDLTICFYGGEPLLKNRTIYKIMDMFPNARFCLQVVFRMWFYVETNATLLKTVKDDYLMKMDTILCSIDGRPEITNKCRGNGTYERIMENVECIKAKGFKNDIVARMTVSVSQGGDIYEEVMHILDVWVIGFLMAYTSSTRGSSMFTGNWTAIGTLLKMSALKSGASGEMTPTTPESPVSPTSSSVNLKTDAFSQLPPLPEFCTRSVKQVQSRIACLSVRR